MLKNVTVQLWNGRLTVVLRFVPCISGGELRRCDRACWMRRRITGIGAALKHLPHHAFPDRLLRSMRVVSWAADNGHQLIPITRARVLLQKLLPDRPAHVATSANWGDYARVREGDGRTGRGGACCSLACSATGAPAADARKRAPHSCSRKYGRQCIQWTRRDLPDGPRYQARPLDFAQPHPREPMEAEFVRCPHRQVNDATAHEWSAVGNCDNDAPAIVRGHSHFATER
jgi:hypothetical protein